MSRLLLALASVALTGCSCRRATPAADAPNVLLLSVDTLRADYLSGDGYDLPTTPTLDALIAQGSWFEAITPVPRTTPALASLLTGRYPQRHGVRRLHDSLWRVPTLASAAYDAGYDTLAVVSNHIASEQRGLNRGFRVYDHANDARQAPATTAASLQALDAAEPGRPVLLWTHYIDPHVPYYPPQPLARRFDPDYRGPYKRHFGPKPGGVGKHAYPADLPKAKAVFDNPLSDEVNAHIRRLYAADIRHTDDAIADLLDGLRQRRGDNWIVVFTADHGESLGEHNFFYDHGDYVYQPTLHVPLAFIDLRSPRSTPQRVAGWVSLVDVAPTLASQLGWSLDDVDGRSLSAQLNGAELPPKPVFAECGRSFFADQIRRRSDFTVPGRFRAVLQGDSKLIFTPGMPAASAYELYDLGADPHELHDLSASRDASELQQALRTWMAADDQGADMPEPSADDIEQLRALGYIDER